MAGGIQPIRRFKMLCSTVSAAGNVLTAWDLDDTGPNESFSARMYRQQRTRREAFVNWLFNDDTHCEGAHETDVDDARALLRARGEY